MAKELNLDNIEEITDGEKETPKKATKTMAKPKVLTPDQKLKLAEKKLKEAEEKEKAAKAATGGMSPEQLMAILEHQTKMTAALLKETSSKTKMSDNNLLEKYLIDDLEKKNKNTHAEAITNASLLDQKMKQVMASEEKYFVQIPYIYKEHFGNIVPIMVNGVVVDIAVGKTYTLPKSLALAVQHKINKFTKLQKQLEGISESDIVTVHGEGSAKFNSLIQNDNDPLKR